MSLVPSGEFQNAILKFLHYEKQIKELQEKMKPIEEKIKEIKDNKVKLENRIILYMKKNDYENSKINVNNEVLQIGEINKRENITKEYLNKKLLEYFKGDNKRASDLLNYIYKEREIENKKYIKISSIKT